MSLALYQKSGGAFGVVWGQNGTYSGSGVPTGKTSAITDSIGAQTLEKFADPATGALDLLLIAGQFQEATIEVFPSSTTLTLGKAQNILPTVGAEVTLTDLQTGDQTGGVKYRVTGATRNRRAGGMVSITMNLWRGESDMTPVAAS